jgi:hypothetical protein
MKVKTPRRPKKSGLRLHIEQHSPGLTEEVYDAEEARWKAIGEELVQILVDQMIGEAKNRQ